MGRRLKGILTGVLFIIVGAVICGVCMMSMGFDLGGLRLGTYKNERYDVKEEFKNIRIVGKTENITFVISEDGNCSVVCYEEVKSPHSVKVVDDTLVIDTSSDRNWVDFFTFWAQDPRITVFLTEESYKELNIISATGDTEIPAEFSFTEINIKTDTGDIKCDVSEADNVVLATQTGSVSISTPVKNVLSVSTAMGDVTLNDCDASAIKIRTETGDVSGTVLSDKSFEASSETGDVNVPDTSGGKCSISTATGDIDIRISDQR